jgi:hypothetical protein
LPLYCVSEIREFIKELDSYVGRNWGQLKKDLKSYYWEEDEEKYSVGNLHKLISDSQNGKINLSAYVARYTIISEHLLKEHALLKYDQARLLLEGLTDSHRSRVFDICWKEKVPLSEKEAKVHGTESDYNKVKAIVLRETGKQMVKMEWEKDRATRIKNTSTVAPTTTDSPRQEDLDNAKTHVTTTETVPPAPAPAQSSPASLSTPAKAQNDHNMEAMMEAFNRLSLQLAALQSNVAGTSSAPAQPAFPTRPYAPRPYNCHFCDSPEHCRNNCPDFIEAQRIGLVMINERGRIADARTREEFRLNPGRGGIKQLLSSSQASPVPFTPSAATANTRAITVDYGTLGTVNSTMQTTLDFTTGHGRSEIVDAEVEMKRSTPRQGGRQMDKRPRFQDDDRSATPQSNPETDGNSNTERSTTQ